MAELVAQLPEAAPRAPVESRRRVRRRLALLVVLGGALAFASFEIRASALQARLFHALARQMRFEVAAGPNPALRVPDRGPYDERLGYARLDAYVERLAARGFHVETQARHSPMLRGAGALGLPAPLPEKASAGLRVLGRGGAPLFLAGLPGHVFGSFEEIPPLLVEALLFVENRELLDDSHPLHNPAVEWDRLGRAALLYPFRWLDAGRPFGGSTLATQLEKFRHSPGGRTASVREKLRQILAASLRAYRDGPDTRTARREIVLDYLNGVPLAAVPGYGEVIGIGDGLERWFGADLEHVGALLRELATPTDPADPAHAAERGLAFRRALGLVLAAQRPSTFLRHDRAALEQRVDHYLALLLEAGRVPAQLHAGASATRLEFASLTGTPLALGPPLAERVAAPVRANLVPLLGTRDLHQLDRLDLRVESTLDADAQREADALLRGLRDPARVAELGLVAPRLLARGDPSAVSYGLVLYERVAGASLLRVQVHSAEAAFDLSEGSRIDLGSTAKLRTLVTYLEAVAALHQALAGHAPGELLRLGTATDPRDPLTAWAARRLAQQPGLPLQALLEQALERRYSASPAERFFTAGGWHRFQNFDGDDDGRVLSVREALRRSVNLPFIRLMRDVAGYHAARLVEAPTRLLEDPHDPRRRAYLRRFAERESARFVERFRARHQELDAEASLARLLGSRPAGAERLALLLRSLEPGASFESFFAALRARLPELPEERARRLYALHAPGAFALVERAYLAGVHPLELWVAARLRQTPAASGAELREASADARREAYAWLFHTRRKFAQDRAIASVLERDVFAEIERAWRRLGYPFPDLVPSYASAIGSSGDRPAALAELVGILLADGVHEAPRRLERLHFAEGTPWETVLAADPPAAERRLPVEVARVARSLLVETVEHGTARRAHRALHGADGTPLVLGGKTGTGDRRFERFGRHGQLLSSEVRSRTACFAFFVGERFYGVLTAHVEGAGAARYAFTSGLPVELVRVLAPVLEPLVARAEQAAPEAGPPALASGLERPTVGDGGA